MGIQYTWRLPGASEIPATRLLAVEVNATRDAALSTEGSELEPFETTLSGPTLTTVVVGEQEPLATQVVREKMSLPVFA